jgi:hypothetical protein
MILSIIKYYKKYEIFLLTLEVERSLNAIHVEATEVISAPESKPKKVFSAAASGRPVFIGELKKKGLVKAAAKLATPEQQKDYEQDSNKEHEL